MDEHSTTTRRRFLGTAAGATGVALGAAVWGTNQAAAAVQSGGSPQRLPADTRSFVAGNFGVDLDGIMAGWVHSAEGGHATSDVVTEKLGADHIARKHLAGVKYEDITLQMGLSMSKAIYDWIAASWNMNFLRKNGAVVAADFNFQVKSVRQFYNALITETGIPACDASSKDAAYMTVKFAPEYTRVVKSSGGGKATNPPNSPQKMWLPSNFRLEIDGLDCTKVNKIDAFTVKQSIIDNPVGEQRDYQKEPATVEFPNLKVTFAATSVGTWEKWFDDFLIKGINGQDAEKSGRLTFLSPNRQDELGHVNFFNIGIFALTDDPSVTGDDQIARWTAELYVERMEFSIIGGAGKPGPSPTPTPPPNTQP